MHTPLLRLIALLSLGLPLSAQPWETLHGLDPRARIRVQSSGGAEYQGRLKSVTADAISFETDRGAVSVERTRVRRVQVRSARRRIGRIVMAGAIGLVVGVITDQTLGARFRNETGETAGARAVTYAAPIAIFGTIAGALPAYRTVYRGAGR